ncbi:MAG TPA: hypothetical protein VFB60_00220 [Ktedonobacteraceae bacterium]|nr:hypothetical protein [Ktedonobacteraceae bacterium]
MSRNINYRKQLLQAVKAFLEGTPASLTHAQQIIKQCYDEIHAEAKEATLDRLFWDPFIVPLTDSVYYKDNTYLREMRRMLLGDAPPISTRTIMRDDFRSKFTADEMEWYTQLLSIVDFITSTPYVKIHEATFSAWQDQATWAKTRQLIPEALQVEEIEKEYRQRKELVETIAARNPSPEKRGDETIYHLALQEVTLILTGLSVGRAAVYYGYPMLDGSYGGYGKATELAPGNFVYVFDMTESVQWSKRVLEALAGQGGLLLSWRLIKAPAFDADMLLVSLQA